jgi:hypothetical protein
MDRRTYPYLLQNCIVRYFHVEHKKMEKCLLYCIGETAFSWHTFHFLIFYNFHTNDTKKKMVLVARVILRLCKKI